MNNIMYSRCDNIDCFKCPLNNLCKIARTGYDNINRNTQDYLFKQIELFDKWTKELREEIKRIKDENNISN